MLRSVALLSALLILPGLVSAQEEPVAQQGTHEVVKGETLWALAERYLGDPFRWPLIYEANRDRIEDPHWIYPRQVFIIPGLRGEPVRVVEVEVVEPGQEARIVSVEPRPAFQEMPPCPGPTGRTVFYEGGEADRGCAMESPTDAERTAFYGDPFRTATGVEGISRDRFHAVPRHLVYSTPWLEKDWEAELPSLGTVTRLSGVDSERTPRDRAALFEKVHIEPEGGVQLEVGDVLQTFRVRRAEEMLGQVVEPTGILVVTDIEEAGVVGAVSAEFDRVRVGQRLRRVPGYDLVPGQKAVEVESDMWATILGFGIPSPLQGFGAVAFLDVGEGQGIETGDEFLAYVNRGDGWSGQEAARLQVVLVNGETTSARVIGVTEPLLAPGTELRLVRKMQ